jgi:hypothetical protein
MQESLQNQGGPPSEPRTRVVTIVMASVVAVAMILTLWNLLQPFAVRKAPRPEVVNLKMAPAEQDYLENVQIGNVSLSRAENFIHQEVTILNGEVYNAGTAVVSGLRLTVTFSDQMNQIVLRETRGILGAPELPLAPGERRSFEISFDHVPNSWNLQQPVVAVAYLQLPRR